MKKITSEKTFNFLNVKNLPFILMAISFLLTTSVIEAQTIDGNPSDWCAVLSNTDIPRIHVKDVLNGSNDDSQFTEGTSDVVPLEDWVWANGNVSAKSDLGNVGAALNGCTLTFFADRYAANGDTDLGLWIFKDPNISLNEDGTFTGVHLDGDLLITSKFTNGGGRETVKIYIWKSGLKLLIDTEGTGNTLDYITKGFVNSGDPTEVPCGWDYTGKFNPTDRYISGTFFEARVNLCNLSDYAVNEYPNISFVIDPCFSNIIFKTSQSQEPTSANGDLVLATFDSQPREKTVQGSEVCEGSSGGGTVSVEETVSTECYTLQVDDGGNWINYQKDNADYKICGPGDITFQDLPTGTYRISAQTNATNCTLTYGQVDVKVNANPTVQDATDAFCYADQTNKSLSDYDSTVNVSGGDQVTWYSDSGRTTPASSTGGALSVDVHYFYATVTNTTSGCTSDAKLTITINANPTVQDATDAFCYADQTNKSLSDYDSAVNVSGGDQVTWYSDSGRTTPASSTGGALSVGVHYFYATVTNTTSGCSSDAKLTITINANPTVQDATDAFCYAYQTNKSLSDYDSTVNVSGGDQVDWYSDSGRTTPASSTGGALSVGVHYFYATVTNTTSDCSSDAKLTITINANPTVQDATDAFCYADQTNKSLSDYDSTVNVSGGDQVTWYSDSGRTTPASSTGGALSVGVHYFYATVTNTTSGCTSDAKLTITINANPTVQDATDAFCYADQTNKSLSDYDSAVNVSGGDQVTWYSDSGRTTPASSTGGALSVGVHYFYATVTNTTSGCSSDAKLTITINANPTVQDATDAFCYADQTNKSLSDYDSTVNVSGGDQVTWYSDSGRTTPASSTGGALSVGVHYFYATVTNTTSDCSSDAKLTITINAEPTVQIQQPFGEDVCVLDLYDPVPEGTQGDPTPIQFKVNVNGSPWSGNTSTLTGVWSGDVDSNGNYDPTKNPNNPDKIITFTVTNNDTQCVGSDTIEFTVSIPQDTPYQRTYCLEDAMNGIDLNSEFVPSGATDIVYSGAGLSDQGIFTANSTGIYPVNITFNDGSTCPSIASITITIQDCLSCETAFARFAASPYGIPEDNNDDSYCFISESLGELDSNRWGWTNKVSLTDFTLENNYTIALVLYAGAGQCDVTKGVAVGEVYIHYTGSKLETTYVMYPPEIGEPGYVLTGAHLYIGEDPYPKMGKGNKSNDYTVAPGKYPFNSGGVDPTNHLEFTSLENVPNEFYVIAHADVCTSITSEYFDQVWLASQDEFVKLNKNNDSVISGTNTGGGKASSTLSSTSLTEASDPIFSVAPVPFSDQLNIGYIFDYTSNVTIQVFDLNGRLLKTYYDTAVNSSSISTFNVDFRTKSGQIYIVRMTTDREVYSAEVIAK